MKRRSSIVLAVLLAVGAAFAHPVDECVEAAYLTLGTDSLELELDLTPGERVAVQMLDLIDQNRDGQMDRPEVQRYAERVLEDLDLNVDGKSQTLKLESVLPPSTQAFLDGGGTIKLVARADLTAEAGSHTLEFRNSHAPVKSGYLANVFVQSGEVKVLEQQRDATQQVFQVRYELEARAPRFDWVWPIPAILAATVLAGWWLMWTKRRLDAIPQS
jgi:hypothetical protein